MGFLHLGSILLREPIISKTRSFPENFTLCKSAEQMEIIRITYQVVQCGNPKEPTATP